METKPPFDPQDLHKTFAVERRIDVLSALQSYYLMLAFLVLELLCGSALLVIGLNGLEANSTFVGVLWIYVLCVGPLLFAATAATFGSKLSEPWFVWGIMSVLVIPIGMIAVLIYARHKLSMSG